MTNILIEQTKQNAKINLKYGTLIRWNTAKLMIYDLKTPTFEKFREKMF